MNKRQIKQRQNRRKKLRMIRKCGVVSTTSFIKPIQATVKVETKAAVKATLPEPQEKPVSSKSAAPHPSRSQNKNQKPRKWSVSQFPVEPEEGKSRFHDFRLPAGLMHGIADLNFRYCTPIQQKALPDVIAGKDLIGKASTGTGKSAVFLIGIFARLIRDQQQKRKNGTPRALIIAPTRELVIQIAKDARDIGKYLPLRVAEAYGGTDYERQQKNIRDRPVDILVATPGRLLDFSRKRVVQLHEAAIMVIDEADRMLDMGFIPDVRSIIHKTPNRDKRQTLMFSATITEEVTRLASQWCVNPVSVETEAEKVAVETVTQIVYTLTRDEKYRVLYNIIKSEECDRVIIFTNMKRDAKRLNDRLRRDGVNCTLLTGDVPQQKRTARLESFRNGKIHVMVATDVAGRGIHIDGISHVVNFTLPYEPEDYVHRIGRTGRAGAEGISISFADEESSFYLMDIEEYIGETLPCVAPEEELLQAIPRKK
jgi:ATP-dependent RNA helicase RhlB